MKRIIFMLLFCLSSSPQATEESVATLGAEFWFTPRHGDVITANEGVKAAVNKLIAEPQAYLVLRYPPTESGELWGRELQAWLISLGLVSDRIKLEVHAELFEAVELVVIGPEAKEEKAPLQIDAPVQGSVQIAPESSVTASPATVAADTAAQPKAEISEEAVTVDAADIEVRVESELK